MIKQAWWLCHECDHVMKDVVPPDKCPKCKKLGSFTNITRNVPKTAPAYPRSVA